MMHVVRFYLNDYGVLLSYIFDDVLFSLTAHEWDGHTGYYAEILQSDAC